jgi:ornithine carbamoyltransferase
MNLISLAEWSREQIEHAIELALRIKRNPEEYAHMLVGRVLLMIFQKPSLRTRLSFEVAMLQMGGHALHYDLGMSPWAAGKESAADTSRTSSRYVSAIMARLFNRADMLDLAAHASVPVINGLTDFEHPCQALGDLLTIRERKGGLAGVKLAFVGDGNNNVTHSLIDGCSKVGMHISVGCPAAAAYLPAAEVRSRAAAFAKESDARIDIVHDARAAVGEADVVYTDTWMSYHIPAEKRDERFHALRSFQVTTDLMRHAKPDAVFMHCLPAQRGVEQTADVIDGPQSIVFDQAENRLHVQKAVLALLLAPDTGDLP